MVVHAFSSPVAEASGSVFKASMVYSQDFTKKLSQKTKNLGKGRKKKISKLPPSRRHTEYIVKR